MPGDALSRIDFSDKNYTLKQSTIRNAYTLYDSQGDEVISTKQKMFKMKEEFPFSDPEGNDVFTVKAENMMDIAGDYAITDAGTGEKIAVLKKDFTFLIHSWRVEDPEGNQLALIQSRGKLVGLLRSLSDLANLFPHKYTIENADGEQIGSIQGRFSLGDKYDIELEEDVDNRESILAAVVTIDALEGN